MCEVTSNVLRGAPTTKLIASDLRVTFMDGLLPAESWSWQLAVIKYRGSVDESQQRVHAKYFGGQFLVARIVLDDPIVFDATLANLAAGIVLLSKDRPHPLTDIFFEGLNDPVIAAQNIREFFTKRIGRNVTALTIADEVTLRLIDILLDRRPGTLTPRLLCGSAAQTCMITLQNDQFGDPQIKWIKPNIFGKEEPMTREEIDLL